MQTDTILATLVDNPGLSARQLALRSGAKLNTVETVLQRHQEALSVSRSKSSGRKGRPENVYAVKGEWLSLLRRRLSYDEDARRPGVLGQAIATLEAASFAAVDPLETEGARRRMASMVALRARASRALLPTQPDEALRDEASARIGRAEARSRKAIGTGGEPTPSLPVPAPAGSLWVRWVTRLDGLARKYGGEVIGSRDDGGRVSMILDLVPDRDSIRTSLLRALGSRDGYALRVPVADLAEPRRSAFLADFETLALDPAAAGAGLFVTVDSSTARSASIWGRIARLAGRKHLARAVEIAQRTMVDDILGRTAAPETVAPARDYYIRFVDGLIREGAKSGRFWRSYGVQHVVDLGTDRRFRARVEKESWNYLATTDSTDIEALVAGALARAAENRLPSP